MYLHPEIVYSSGPTLPYSTFDPLGKSLMYDHVNNVGSLRELGPWIEFHSMDVCDECV